MNVILTIFIVFLLSGCVRPDTGINSMDWFSDWSNIQRVDHDGNFNICIIISNQSPFITEWPVSIYLVDGDIRKLIGLGAIKTDVHGDSRGYFSIPQSVNKLEINCNNSQGGLGVKTIDINPLDNRFIYIDFDCGFDDGVLSSGSPKIITRQSRVLLPEL